MPVPIVSTIPILFITRTMCSFRYLYDGPSPRITRSIEPGMKSPAFMNTNLSRSYSTTVTISRIR